MRACSAASLQESKGRHVTGGPLRVLPVQGDSAT